MVPFFYHSSGGAVKPDISDAGVFVQIIRCIPFQRAFR